MIPKFENLGGAIALKCPHCPSIYLRHGQVDVYERREDAAAGLHVSVVGEKAHIDSHSPLVNDTSANPSSRREGTVITFGCENCGKESKLSIAQHKGQTLIEHK